MSDNEELKRRLELAISERDRAHLTASHEAELKRHMTAAVTDAAVTAAAALTELSQLKPLLEAAKAWHDLTTNHSLSEKTLEIINAEAELQAQVKVLVDREARRS